MYSVVMKMTGDDVVYMIVKQSDLGAYVVAETWDPRRAKLIVAAFEKAETEPPPF